MTSPLSAVASQLPHARRLLVDVEARAQHVGCRVLTVSLNLTASERSDHLSVQLLNAGDVDLMADAFGCDVGTLVPIESYGATPGYNLYERQTPGVSTSRIRVKFFCRASVEVVVYP